MNAARYLLYAFTAGCAAALFGLLLLVSLDQPPNSAVLSESATPPIPVPAPSEVPFAMKSPAPDAAQIPAAEPIDGKHNRKSDGTDKDSTAQSVGAKQSPQRQDLDSADSGRPDVVSSRFIRAAPVDEVIASTEEFVQVYRELRSSPQMKLLDYRDKPFVRWRCYIHGTSDTGLGWALAHLPSSSPDELELRLILENPAQEGRLLDQLLNLRATGREPMIETVVRGRVGHFLAGLANPNGRPTVVLADSAVTSSGPTEIASTSPDLVDDVRDAASFLQDWRRIDPDDPSGDFWVSDQLHLRRYTNDRPIDLYCRIVERTDTGDFRGVVVSRRNGELPVRISPNQMSRRAARNWDFPTDAIARGFLRISQGMVFLQDAALARHKSLGDAVSEGTSVADNAAPREDEDDLRVNEGADGPEDSISKDDASDDLARSLVEFSKTTSFQQFEPSLDGTRIRESLKQVKQLSGDGGELYPITYGAYVGFLYDLVSDRKLVIDDGTVRAVAKDFGRDVAAVRRYVSNFETPKKEDVYATRGFDERSQSAYQRLDAYYYFTQAIVCVSAIASNSPDGPNEVSAVMIVEKAWLLQIARNYATDLEKNLRWIGSVMRSDRLELSQMPAITGLRRTYSPLGERNVLKTNITGTISEAVIYETQAGPFLLSERFDHDLEPDHLVPAAGTVRVRLNSNVLPGKTHPILSCGVIGHLRCLLHARIAEQIFASKTNGARKGAHPRTGFEYYYWLSKANWQVEVGPDYIELEK